MKKIGKMLNNVFYSPIRPLGIAAKSMRGHAFIPRRGKGFLLIFIMNSAFAYTGFNVCNHGNETLDKVVCDGPAVLKQTIIKGDTNISGTLQAEGITAASLTVLGDTRITNATVSGQVKVTGNLTAYNVKFAKGVAVEGDKIILSQSQVKGSLIITSKDTTPYVQLQCSSSIKGNILFDGKAGVVQVSVNSVAQGKISNGASVFVENPAITGSCDTLPSQ